MFPQSLLCQSLVPTGWRAHFFCNFHENKSGLGISGSREPDHSTMFWGLGLLLLCSDHDHEASAFSNRNLWGALRVTRLCVSSPPPQSPSPPKVGRGKGSPCCRWETLSRTQLRDGLACIATKPIFECKISHLKQPQVLSFSKHSHPISHLPLNQSGKRLRESCSRDDKTEALRC